MKNKNLNKRLTGTLLLIFVSMLAFSQFKTITPEQVEKETSGWALMFINIIMTLGAIVMGINLVKVLSAANAGKGEAADKAWLWGGLLVMFVVGGVLINLYMGWK